MLTDEQWLAIEPFIPRSHARTGRPPADPRRVLDAVLFVLATGCPWRALPRERFGLPWQTAYHHFNAWRAAGVFARLVEHLRSLAGGGAATTPPPASTATLAMTPWRREHSRQRGATSLRRCGSHPFPGPLPAGGRGTASGG